MDPATAERLVGPEGAEALALAALQADPTSLSAATVLRAAHEPRLAAAALAQTALRRSAAARFGPVAGQLFWTADGLEQATRPVVSAWRAERFVDRGVERVVDLGSGIGADSLALARAGLEVVAVELDPTTAVLARANLAPWGVEVRCADATAVAADLLGPRDGVFCDPARRTGRGRTWQVDAFRPPYDFVTGLLAERVGCAKFGPGMPYALIPPEVDTTWISAEGDLVEASLWSPGADRRSALLLPEGHQLEALPGTGGPSTAAVSVVASPGEVLIEPDPAVIRADAVDALAARLGAWRLAPQIAYLSADQGTTTPYGTSFEVLESMPWKEKVLRAWIRHHEVGTVEIKKRGIEVDPAALRQRLRPEGTRSATLILTPTPEGARVLVVRRQ